MLRTLAGGILSVIVATLVPVIICFGVALVKSMGALDTLDPPLSDLFSIAAIALAHVVILGIPTALIVKRFYPLTTLVTVICGFFIGIIPYVAFFIYGMMTNDIESETNIASGFVIGALQLGALGIAGALAARFTWQRFPSRTLAS